MAILLMKRLTRNFDHKTSLYSNNNFSKKQTYFSLCLHLSFNLGGGRVKNIFVFNGKPTSFTYAALRGVKGGSCRVVHHMG